MSITLNLKNDSIVQYVTPGKTYSEFSHRDNDKSSAIDIGVKTLEDNSKESFIGLNADKIYHNGNNITPNNFITNCITEIPQDIKVEIDTSYNLIAKAGTKVYFGDNTSITLLSDINYSYSPTFPSEPFLFAILKSDSILVQARMNACVSSATNPGTAYIFWFCTEDNKCYWNDDSGIASEISLPIALVTHTNGTGWTNLDQIFNGLGYIGATVFALPGVKGLIPDYRNPDGSLKNVEFTTSSVLTKTDVGRYGDEYVLALNASRLDAYLSERGYDDLVYKEKENINYNYYNNINAADHIARVGFISCDRGRITSFRPKTVFHAVDYSDFNEHRIIGVQRPDDNNGYEWFRLYSDGWVEQGGIAKLIANNSNYTVVLPITMADGNYTVTIAQCATDDSDYQAFYRNHGVVLSRRRGAMTLSNRRFNGTDTYTIDIMWEVKGMSAI